MAKKILVVDDEKPISGIVKFNLEKEGYEAVVAYDGEAALEQIEAENPDLTILDLILPKIDGPEMAKRVRAKHTMPIIMVTAKDSEPDKALGLELGADNCVTKPFSNRELVARVKANLRQQATLKASAEEENNTDIQVGDLTIHPEAYTTTKRDENINLARRESELLHYLAQHIGQVINREHLLQTVWGYGYFGDIRTADVTVRRLREKVEGNPSHPQWLITRHGIGYYLANPDQN